jgi:hypothetical protein
MTLTVHAMEQPDVSSNLATARSVQMSVLARRRWEPYRAN